MEKLADKFVDQVQNSTHKLMDTLIDELFNRVLKISPMYHAEMERATLGKPNHLAMPQHAALSSLSPRQKTSGAIYRKTMPGRPMQLAIAPVGRSCSVWFTGSATAASAILVHATTAENNTLSLSGASIYHMEYDHDTGELQDSNLPEGTGIYAVFDKEGKLHYVGLSKQIRKTVQNHAKAIGPAEAPFLISDVKCAEVKGDAKDLQQTWKAWINGHMKAGGEIPPGNVPKNAPGFDPRWTGLFEVASAGVRGQGRPGKPPLSLGPKIKSMEEAMEAVKTTVTTYPVVLFMKGTPAMPECGFSGTTIGLMNNIGLDFESVNVLDAEANPLVREAVKQYSQWPTIPQLFVQGELLGGADIISDMHEAGELKKTLEVAISGNDVAETSSTGASGPEVAAPGKVELVDSTSRPTATKMSQVFKDNFQLHTLRIVDSSAAHEGDAGAIEMGLSGESHFDVELVSLDFEGLSQLQRQQKVYDALGDLMQQIHAITFVTKTPAELSPTVNEKTPAM